MSGRGIGAFWRAGKSRACLLHHNRTPRRCGMQIGHIERALFEHLEKNGRVTLREYRHLVNISERRASRSLVHLVRAGLIRIFTNEAEDYYMLA